MVSWQYLSVAGYYQSLPVTDKSAYGHSARQGYVLDLIAGYFGSLYDVELGYIGVGKGETLDVGYIGIEHHLVYVAGGNLLLVDYRAYIKFLSHVDVVYVLNLGYGLGHSETLGCQAGQDVGLGIIGQSDECLGMLNAFAHEQTGIAAVTVYYHNLVINQFGETVAAFQVTLNDLEIHIVGHKLCRAYGYAAAAHYDYITHVGQFLLAGNAADVRDVFFHCHEVYQVYRYRSV